MSKRSSSRRKVPVEVWVALVGLVGVIVAAILNSPILPFIIQSPPAPRVLPTQTLIPVPTDTRALTVTGITHTPAIATGVLAVMPSPAVATDVPTVTSPPCIPSDLSELPPQAVAIIMPLEGGATSRAEASTLRYEHMSNLKLASGIAINFKQMRSFEIDNPDFINHFTADVVVTFLNCTTHEDSIKSYSYSFLTAETEFGPLSLHILKVKRVDFQ